MQVLSRWATNEKIKKYGYGHEYGYSALGKPARNPCNPLHRSKAIVQYSLVFDAGTAVITRLYCILKTLTILWKNWRKKYACIGNRCVPVASKVTPSRRSARQKSELLRPGVASRFPLSQRFQTSALLNRDQRHESANRSAMPCTGK